MRLNWTARTVTAVLYLVMFTWVSVSGVTLGNRQILPAGPLTALAVTGAVTVAAFLLGSVWR